MNVELDPIESDRIVIIDSNSLNPNQIDSWNLNEYPALVAFIKHHWDLKWKLVLWSDEAKINKHSWSFVV